MSSNPTTWMLHYLGIFSGKQIAFEFSLTRIFRIRAESNRLFVSRVWHKWPLFQFLTQSLPLKSHQPSLLPSILSASWISELPPEWPTKSLLTGLWDFSSLQFQTLLHPTHKPVSRLYKPWSGLPRQWLYFSVSVIILFAIVTRYLPVKRLKWGQLCFGSQFESG